MARLKQPFAKFLGFDRRLSEFRLLSSCDRLTILASFDLFDELGAQSSGSDEFLDLAKFDITVELAPRIHKTDASPLEMLMQRVFEIRRVIGVEH